MKKNCARSFGYFLEDLVPNFLYADTLWNSCWPFFLFFENFDFLLNFGCRKHRETSKNHQKSLKNDDFRDGRVKDDSKKSSKNKISQKIKKWPTTIL